MSESHLPDNLIFHGNGGSYPPHGRITAENHGPAVVVASWIMVCLMGLAIIARFGTRPNLGRDSITIFSACVGLSCHHIVSPLSIIVILFQGGSQMMWLT